MKVNYSDVIKVGRALYYKLNPESKMDVPSYFYQKIETHWIKWKESNSELTFLKYCENSIE